MATDYDAPRNKDEDLATESIEELKARRASTPQTAAVDIDESDLAESLELPGADLSKESLSVRVLPKQQDEFTCSICFLVHHRSQYVSGGPGHEVCRDCAD